MAQSREIEKLQRRWQENPLGLTFAPLAEAYRKEGMYAEALELLELGLAQHPNYVPAHIVSARCQIDVGAEAKAEAAFLRVAELDPENVIALRGVADIAERGGRFQEAATQLEALLLFDRNNEEARLQLSRVRSMLVTPSPGTIDPDRVMLPAEAPDQPAAPAEPAEPTVPLLMPQVPDAERPTPSDAGVTSPSVVLDGVVADPVEEPAVAEPVDEDRSAVAPSDAVEFEEPQWAGDPVDEAQPVVEAEVLADPPADLEVQIYHPMELTAAGATEYQQASDAEALRGGATEEAGEQGERVVPLFAGGEPEQAAPEAQERMVPLFAGGEPERAAPEAQDSAPAADGTPIESPPAVLAEDETEHDEPAMKDEDAGAEESVDEAEEPDLVVTETMAEVFLRQGHRELALAVYSQLRQREPDNARIQVAIERLEQEFRPGRGPSLPAYAAALTGGRSVRSYLEAVFTAPVPNPGDPDGLALGSVFGDEPAGPPAPEEEMEGGPSFEEFFAGDASEPTGAPSAEPRPAPAASEDIEEFNAWLRGLKR